MPYVITRKHCPRTQSNTSSGFKPLIQSKQVRVGYQLYTKKRKSIVVQCSRIIFLMRQKQHNCIPNLKTNLPLFLPLGRSDSLICLCVYFKLVVNSLQNSLQHNYIVKLAILYTCYILNCSLKFCYFCEHHTAIAYAPPGNQLLLCVVSIVK